VLAAEGWLADVMAKACFLRPDRALELLTDVGAAALLVDDAGTVTFLNGAEAYER
jgi:hypothetical protein